MSPQNYAECNNFFETVDSLSTGAEPARWESLETHQRGYHLNNEGKRTDRAKYWTDVELESFTIFEVPKESTSSSKTVKK